MTETLDPNLLVQAYARGIFPMAETRESSEIYWVEPEERGVLPLDRFHVPRRLRRVVRGDPFRVTIDAAFAEVIGACGAVDYARGRFESWINPEIERAYIALHRLGIAHSLECWRQGELAGGIYGVALGGAFFGESMFSRQTNASKVALVHMAAELRRAGYRLFDAQFVNDHLKQFNIQPVPKAAFKPMLWEALAEDRAFPDTERAMTGAEALSILTP